MTLDSERPFQGLTYDSSAERLRQACRFGVAVLLATPLLPFEAVAGRPVFVWQIWGELHPATLLAALWPWASGVALLLATRFVAQPSVLARLTLLVLATWSLVVRLGAEAAAWDVGALPESLNRRIEPYVLSIALSGAALRLLAEPAARKAARITAALAVLGGLSFGIWPGKGEAPFEMCLRFLLALGNLPDVRLVLGYGLLLVIAVFPLLAAGVALSLSLTGRGQHTALVAELVTFGVPGLIFALALRNVLVTYGDSSVVVTMAIALGLAALLALTARALELTALWATGVGVASDRESSAAHRYLLPGAGATALVAVVAVFVLSRPVEKGITWQLGARSEQADRVFGDLMPKWALSRTRWGLQARNAASAAELAEARAAGGELLRAARELSPELGRVVGELVNGASELDLAGRRWFRLVEGVNEVSRQQRLPYYLDPGLRLARHQGGVERLFLIHPYRVEAVKPVQAHGIGYALLGVRRLGAAREGHGRLGFSRDHQPFALVVLDEIEPYATTLGTLSQREPPSCVEGAQASSLMERCGALLRRLAPSLQQVRLQVERHELQHQVDGPTLAHSPAVLRALQGFSDEAIDEVNRELSAYLAELVTERVSPKLALVHLAPFLEARKSSALRFVAELQLAALTGRESAAEVDYGRAFDELAAMPDEALRERARQAYRELFDADLPQAEP